MGSRISFAQDQEYRRQWAAERLLEKQQETKMVDLSRLADFFEQDQIEWRIGRSGESNGKIWAKCLAYVTNRHIMQRLDEVCGPGGWRNECPQYLAQGVVTGISIKVGDEWITKWDAAEYPKEHGADQPLAFKGGASGAMKRAAVQWGIGRYLYDLEEGFAEISMERKQDWNYAQTKEKKAFYWRPPQLPAKYLPGGKPVSKPSQQSQAADPARLSTAKLTELRVRYEGAEDADQVNAVGQAVAAAKGQLTEADLASARSLHAAAMKRVRETNMDSEPPHPDPEELYLNLVQWVESAKTAEEFTEARRKVNINRAILGPMAKELDKLLARQEGSKA